MKKNEGEKDRKKWTNSIVKNP